MNKPFTAPVLILAIPMILISAQAPDTLWTRNYGSSYYECGNSILQTSDSCYLILGNIQFSDTIEVIYLIKAALNGDTIWTRTIGGSYITDGYMIQPTSDGGYIIIGRTNIADPSFDCYLVKIDQNGDTLWTRIYGTINTDEEGIAGKQTSDGGYIIAGVTCEYDMTGDLCLIKTDANGDTIWTRHYGSNSMDYGNSVQEIGGGGSYIITGVTEAYADDDVYLVRTDQYGDTVWTRTYGTTNTFDFGQSVVQTPDSGYIIAGWTAPASWVNANVYLVRTDANGDTVWTRKYGGPDDDYAQYIQTTADDQYIITGFTYSYGAGACDVYLIKINGNGDTIWTATFGGSSYDAGLSLAQTTDGGYIITGFTDSYGIGGDVYVVKTRPDTLSIADNGTIHFSAFDWEIFPNPITKNCNIRYVLAQSDRVSINIYDITGRQVKEIINENQDAGVHSIKLNIAGMPQGIYFIRLNISNKSTMKKVVLIR